MKKLMFLSLGCALLVGCADEAEFSAVNQCKLEDRVDGVLLTCGDYRQFIADGNDGVDGTDGQDGVDGENGQDGADGSDGEDGQDGEDGIDAEQSPFTIVEVIRPCASTGSREVLFRLRNGQIIAHYAGGGNTQFLAVLSAGTYYLTDGSNCQINISSEGVVTW